MNNRIIYILLFIFVAFSVTCYFLFENNDEPREKIIVELNPELKDVEAFVADNKDLIAIKKDGSTVMIKKDYLDLEQMHGIDYSDGKLYISFVDTKYEYVSEKSKTKSLMADTIWFEMIDLTKGDGNYENETIYEYTNEDNHTVAPPAPNVYNNKLYFVKNSNQIVEYNILKEKEKILENVNMIMGTTVYPTTVFVNEKEGYLYYMGPIGNEFYLKRYDLNNKNSGEVIDKSKYNVYHFIMFSDDSLIYSTQDTLNHTVSLSSYNFKTKEIKQLKDSIDSGGYFCKNKYFTAIEVGKVYENDYGPHYQDIVVQNEKFETIKEIFKHVSDEHATPIYNFSNSKVQVSDGSKYYLLDCETYELTEMNSLYRIITMYE